MQDNTIIRVEKRERYAVIDKYFLDEDDRLSWKASGQLTYLLAKPNGWEVRISDLINRKKDGRDSVSAGLRELIQAGYLERKPVRGSDGKFNGYCYVVHELPLNPAVEPFAPETENRPLVNTSVKNHKYKDQQQQPIRDHGSIVEQPGSENYVVVGGTPDEIISVPEHGERSAIQSGAEKEEASNHPVSKGDRAENIIAADISHIASREVQTSESDLKRAHETLPVEPARDQLDEINDVIKETAGVKFTLDAARALFYAGKGDMERILKALKGAGAEYRRRKGGKDRVHNVMGWFINAVVNGFVPVLEDEYRDIYLS